MHMPDTYVNPTCIEAKSKAIGMLPFVWTEHL